MRSQVDRCSMMAHARMTGLEWVYLRLVGAVLRLTWGCFTIPESFISWQTVARICRCCLPNKKMKLQEAVEAFRQMFARAATRVSNRRAKLGSIVYRKILPQLLDWRTPSRPDQQDSEISWYIQEAIELDSETFRSLYLLFLSEQGPY